MLKSVLATACTILWLSVSAQITSKTVFSLGAIDADEKFISIDEVNSFAPFKMVGGLVFVNGLYNGQEGSFILDTGAPGLILNSKLKKDEIDEMYIASGLTGNTSIGEMTIDEFRILNIIKSDFQAFQMDLEHIEDEILHRFSGLVGVDIFSNSILVLDYKSQMWGTVPTVNKSEIKSTIPFTMREHFIIVDIVVSGHSYSMIMDTGAEINIIDRASSRAIKKSNLKKAGTTSIQSASRDHLASSNVKLQKFHMQKHVEKGQEFSVIDFDFINEGLFEKLDGLIGYPFFEDKKVAFDFKEGVIYIYK